MPCRACDGCSRQDYGFTCGEAGMADGSMANEARVGGYVMPTPRAARGVGQAWVGAAFGYHAARSNTVPHL